ncbi:MAG TPA: Mur ligase family protein, partial [Thermoanaerobaculia bacterium]|nr:Mur ligase family protein [Thermoanaerobaculia bacterium]
NVPEDSDLVIIGNAATRDNPEAIEAQRRGLAVLSMPQGIARYLLPGKTSVVITGTHGKTTTTALTAWLLLDSGRDPGFIVGGEMKNIGRGYRHGAGAHFVLEGDEYNAAFFDRGPKFLHYQPRHLFIGNIEYDHADIFPDVESILEAFRRVVALVPPDGIVVVNADDDRVLEAARGTSARVARVSLADPEADFAAAEISFTSEGTGFLLVEMGRAVARLRSPLFGLHNVRNALGAIALARGLGLTPEEIEHSLPRFQGVKRRLEMIGERNNICIVDDFAHHPTAVAETLAAARSRWPGRRIWALFEPRSNTAGRRMFQDDYAEAFSAADLLVLAPVFHAKRLTPETTLDREVLVARFSRGGKPGFAPESIDEIPEILAGEARPGDVVILMSSGAFGGLPQKLLRSDESEPP